jgi:hypothetical protein
MPDLFRRILGVSAVATVIFLSCSLLHAQSTNASVTGTVTDSTGATLPGASIELRNTEMNVPSTAITNADGIYRIAGLIPGIYNARVSKDGFRTTLKEQIVLHVQDQIALSFSLELGAVTENVTVQSGEPLLQIESVSLSTVVEPRTVEDMPLNGRNVMNLMTLVPGVVAQGETAGNPTQTNSFVNSWGNYQIGGGFANQSATFLDGAPLNTSYVNSVSLVPSQDSIAEFRIQTNTVSPEYGRFAGGVINMSTKSGTNKVHGSLYEYLRNKVLDANDYFSNESGIPRAPFTMNQFGATLGAPIKKDKTFNFFSWEGFHLRTATTSVYTVPTAAERAGNFAGAANIYDPDTTTFNPVTGTYSRQQFMGCGGNQPNVICSNRFDPAAQIEMNLFPLPPANLANQTIDNFPSAGPSGSDYNQFVDRVDWALSERQHLFGRYTNWGVTIHQINPYGTDAGQPTQTNTDNQIVLGDDYLINTTTTAAVRVSYFRFIFAAMPLSQGFNLSSLSPAWAALAPSIASHEEPVPNLTGITPTQPANFSSIDTHVGDTSNNYAVSGNIAKQIGKHNLAFGGELRQINWAYEQNNNGSGSFTFDQGFTQQNPLATLGTTGGSAIASFVLGTASSGTLENEYSTGAAQWYGGLFADDNYQVNSRLSLHAGLRWEQPGAFTERHNAETVLLPNTVDPLSTATGLSLKGQVARVNTSLYPGSTTQALHWDLFSPRVGFDLKVLENTVLRGGYGISYLPNDVGFASGPYNSPVDLADTSFEGTQNGGLTPFATLSNPFPTGVAQPIAGNGSLLGQLEGTSVSSPIPNEPYSYVQQWNLNLEQQFGAKTVLQIAYAASKGTHLPLYELQLNQIPNQFDALGAALLNPVANPFQGKLPATSTLNTPATIPAGDLDAPYPQFTAFDADSPTVGASTYNALQMTMKRSFGTRGNISASYTWSKLLSNVDTLTAYLETNSPSDQYGAQNAYDLRAERSVSSDDFPQNFVLSYVLDLPIGRGRHWMNQLNGVENGIVGGWTVSGITSFISGQPLGLASQGTTLSADFGAGTPRPNLVPGCKTRISGAAASRVNEWFNTACFTEPDSFGFGNDPRINSDITAAGVADWDVGLSKIFSLSSDRNFQFRAESFNVANRVQMGIPGATLGSGTFGIVTDQGNFPRIFQFSGRINF